MQTVSALAGAAIWEVSVPTAITVEIWVPVFLQVAIG